MCRRPLSGVHFFPSLSHPSCHCFAFIEPSPQFTPSTADNHYQVVQYETARSQLRQETTSHAKTHSFELTSNFPPSTPSPLPHSTAISLQILSVFPRGIFDLAVTCFFEIGFTTGSLPMTHSSLALALFSLLLAIWPFPPHSAHNKSFANSFQSKFHATFLSIHLS